MGKQIKIKGVEFGYQDSPFKATLVVAPSCKIKCKGCKNRELKKLPDLEIGCEELIEMLATKDDIEGIVIGGLEPSENILDFLELSKVADEHGLKVMIETGLTFEEFKYCVGKTCTKSKQFDFEQINKVYSSFGFPVEEDELYRTIGVIAMDYYIKNDFYIKCGRYERDLPCLNRVHFGVEMKSANQNIYKIERTKDEN